MHCPVADRTHGRQYAQQIEDSHKSLEDYVNSLDKETRERMELLDMLEQSELFYDSQYGEAKIVANVCTYISLWHSAHLHTVSSLYYLLLFYFTIILMLLLQILKIHPTPFGFGVE